MKKHRIAVVLVAILSMVGLIAGCGSSSKSAKTSTPSSTPSSTSQTPDYSKSANWLALPSAKSARKKVDVFFLYPTVYEQSSPSDPMVCGIDNSQMQSGAKAAFSRDATVFAPLADIYAPYYQQAAISVLNLPLDQQQAIVGGVPTSDAIAAFDYFIKHYNKGRPFILAAHSQGSNIMINLMAEYMKKNPDVYKRMIAAYVPGYSITPQYLAQNTELKFAIGADDTGVIVSYNTRPLRLRCQIPSCCPAPWSLTRSRGPETRRWRRRRRTSVASPWAATVTPYWTHRAIPRKC